MTDLPVITLDDLRALEPIRLDSFTTDDAVSLGLVAVDVIREDGLDLAVDIRRHGDLVFRAKIGPGTGPGNDEWLDGKAAAVLVFAEPSLLLRRRREAGEELDETPEMRTHGGCNPIFVGDELVGTITMSGEPDVVDHLASRRALERYAASR